MPTALITGSGKRIGKALAIKFAEKGWDIIVHYFHTGKGAEDTVKQIEERGRKAFMIKADLRNENQIIAAFQKAFEEMGIPELLINNSGIFPDKKLITETSIDDWDDIMNINLRSQFICARDFAKVAGKGRIVNIGSLGGLEAWDRRTVYNVSKAGVIHLTKALAKELAPEFSVNCVSPGSILIPGEPGPADHDMRSVSKIPKNRLGNVDDVFDAVYFFATASDYITAQVINVDGGAHI